MPRLPTLPKLSDRRRRWRYFLRKGGWAVAVVAAAAGLIAADHCGAFGRAKQTDAARYDGKTFSVRRVLDGETLCLAYPDGPLAETTVRLLGVGIPHSPQEAGEALDFVRAAATGAGVRLELDATRFRQDGSNDLLAYVYLDGGQQRMLNRLLIQEGLAYADGRLGHSRKAEFQHLQTLARKSQKGFWKTRRPEDLPEHSPRDTTRPVP